MWSELMQKSIENQSKSNTILFLRDEEKFYSKLFKFTFASSKKKKGKKENFYSRKELIG